jgi:hypothetical protein
VTIILSLVLPSFSLDKLPVKAYALLRSTPRPSDPDSRFRRPPPPSFSSAHASTRIVHRGHVGQEEVHRGSGTTVAGTVSGTARAGELAAFPIAQESPSTLVEPPHVRPQGSPPRLPLSWMAQRQIQRHTTAVTTTAALRTTAPFPFLPLRLPFSRLPTPHHTVKYHPRVRQNIVLLPALEVTA